MMNETLEVKTTTADHSLAMKIARALVERRLAACVQISGPIESVYRWQGAVETSQEWLCTAKTTRAALPRVQKLIRQLHSYEEPEIIATVIAGGSDTYDYPVSSHPTPAEGGTWGHARNDLPSEYGAGLDAEGESGLHAE